MKRTNTLLVTILILIFVTVNLGIMGFLPIKNMSFSLSDGFSKSTTNTTQNDNKTTSISILPQNVEVVQEERREQISSTENSSKTSVSSNETIIKKETTPKEVAEKPLSDKKFSSSGEPMERIIVSTSKNLSESEISELVGTEGVDVNKLKTISSVSALVPKSQVEKIKNNPNVSNVYEDRVVKISSTPNPVLPDKAYDPTRLTSAPQVWNTNNLLGKDIGVVVMDSGVYPHEDLEDRIIGFKDYIGASTSPYDDNGHGTHVAGIIAGNGTKSFGTVVGVAPKSNIIGVKVLDANGLGFSSTVVRAIDWAILYKKDYNIKVINMSFGMPYTSTDEPIFQAVQKAIDAGIVVVAAGGNEGVGSEMPAPAAHSKVIAVGASDSQGTLQPADDKLASFSIDVQKVNGVSKPEVYAPGEDVLSLLSPDGSRYLNDPLGEKYEGYYVLSGTSMATPVVSGMVALMFENNPSLTPDQVRNTLISKSTLINTMNTVNIASLFGLQPNYETEDIIMYDHLQINETLPKKGTLSLTAKGVFKNSIYAVNITDLIKWSTNNASVATVDESGKVSFTGSAGDVTITARYNGLSAIVSQTVEAPKLTSIKINETLPKKGEFQLSTTGTYDDGTSTTLDSWKGTWKTSDPNIATVDSGGKVTFKGGYGTVTISVIYDNLTATVEQTIDPPKLEGISIDQAIPSKGSIQLTVTARYDDESTKPITSGITWTTSNNKIAYISPKGFLKYTGYPGTVIVTAQYQGQTATKSADSTTPTLTEIKINGQLPKYGTTKLSVTGVYSDLSTKPLDVGVNWTSSNPRIATVSPNGTVTFTGQSGAVTITATYENLKRSITQSAQPDTSNGKNYSNPYINNTYNNFDFYKWFYRKL